MKDDSDPPLSSLTSVDDINTDELTMMCRLEGLEYARYKLWVDKHWAICKTKDEERALNCCIALRFSFTGIGTRIDVSCSSCKSSWDITDYDLW